MTTLPFEARNGRVILEEIDRLDTIIGRLLYFARPIQLNVGLASFSELCFTTADAWRDRQASGGVAVSCEGGPGATILCDRSRILQVLDNLMENAVQSAAARNGGAVSIGTTQGEGFAQIEIRDNGPGLNQDALSQALDPLFTTKESGTGLGLSISFEVIQAHDGKLSLSNHPYGGAVASVRFPLAAQASLLAPATEQDNEQVHG